MLESIKKAKLVIWDLDETFWHGTLSEGGVQPIPENIELVKSLVDRGIMNTIVSKNDFEPVRKVLTEWGIWDLFVFPQISWQPKGEVVKKLHETMGLRVVNSLFMDDNTSNLQEVKFYNPGIEVSLPLTKDEILNHPAFEGKDDKKHSRLAQYHVLENRVDAEKSYSNNEDFLRSSHIKIQICSDCLSEEERIYELVQRTNQLNYTKIRSNREELHSLFIDKNVISAYIRVKDDFGDYGITGFYALKENKLLHFLFSCRTIGFGVENYLYKRLGCPSICIVGDVATQLDKEKIIDWIAVDEEREKQLNSYSNGSEKKKKILMVAGCDLEQAYAYLDSQFKIDTEFTTVINGHEIRTSDTCSLVNTLKLSELTKKELCCQMPFMAEGVTFDTKIYTDKYDVIILSVVDDFIRGMYRHKQYGYYVGFGGYDNQDTFLSLYPKEEYKYLLENFDFIGKENTKVFRDNLETIYNNIHKGTKLIIINGVDLGDSERIGKDRHLRSFEMNKVIDDLINIHPDIMLLDMRKIVVSENQLINYDPRHFVRSVYYDMAKEIIRLCNGLSGNETIRIRNRMLVDFKNNMKKAINRFVFVIMSVFRIH